MTIASRAPWDNLAGQPGPDTLPRRAYQWRDPARCSPARLAQLAALDEDDQPDPGHDSHRARAVHHPDPRHRGRPSCNTPAARPATTTDWSAVTCQKCQQTTPYLDAIVTQTRSLTP